MSSHFTTEIGRMRNDEMIVRAERYRRAARTAHRDTPDETDAPRVHRRRGLLTFVRRLAVTG